VIRMAVTNGILHADKKRKMLAEMVLNCQECEKEYPADSHKCTHCGANTL